MTLAGFIKKNKHLIWWVKDYKKLKGLKKQNLRDNMTNLELVLNMLAEASTAEISKKKQPQGLPAN